MISVSCSRQQLVHILPIFILNPRFNRRLEVVPRHLPACLCLTDMHYMLTLTVNMPYSDLLNQNDSHVSQITQITKEKRKQEYLPPTAHSSFSTCCFLINYFLSFHPKERAFKIDNFVSGENEVYLNESTYEMVTRGLSLFVLTCVLWNLWIQSHRIWQLTPSPLWVGIGVKLFVYLLKSNKSLLLVCFPIKFGCWEKYMYRQQMNWI